VDRRLGPDRRGDPATVPVERRSGAARRTGSERRRDVRRSRVPRRVLPDRRNKAKPATA